jgi:hypothetical protein
MGVDIELKSVFDPWFKAFKASGEMKRIASENADIAERFERMNDAYRSSGGAMTMTMSIK